MTRPVRCVLCKPPQPGRLQQRCKQLHSGCLWQAWAARQAASEACQLLPALARAQLQRWAAPRWAALGEYQLLRALHCNSGLPLAGGPPSPTPTAGCSQRPHPARAGGAATRAPARPAGGGARTGGGRRQAREQRARPWRRTRSHGEHHLAARVAAADLVVRRCRLCEGKLHGDLQPHLTRGDEI